MHIYVRALDSTVKLKMRAGQKLIGELSNDKTDGVAFE